MISFILSNLIIYIPFHLFEEAVGDFPKSVEVSYRFKSAPVDSLLTSRATTFVPSDGVAYFVVIVPLITPSSLEPSFFVLTFLSVCTLSSAKTGIS